MKGLIVPAIIAKTQSEIDHMLNRVQGKLERIMVDVMDGEFVPNTSLLFDFHLPPEFQYEAHLMVNKPLEWIQENGDKVDIAIMHIESLQNIVESVKTVKERGLEVYLALKPETGIETVTPYLTNVDGILEMTADPGSYCTDFLSGTLEKVKHLRDIDEVIPIEVDGCMNPQNAKLAREAGANIFVSGSYILKSDDVDKALKELYAAVE